MKKMMILIGVCALLAGQGTLFADDSQGYNENETLLGNNKQERMQLASILMGLMNVDKSIKQAFKQIQDSLLPGVMKDMGISPTEREKAEKVQKKLFAIYEKEFCWAKMKDDYIKIYAETFSVNELRALVDFFSSPLGKKIIAKNPELMKRSMQVTRKQLKRIMPMIKKKVEELKKAEKAGK